MRLPGSRCRGGRWLAGARSKAVNHAVEARDHQLLLRHRGRGGERGAALPRPHPLAAGEVERENLAAGGGEEGAIAGDDGRRVDARPRGVGPALRAGLGVERVDDLVASADDDQSIVHGGRSVVRELAHRVLVGPADRARVEVDAEHLVLVRADERQVAHDRGARPGLAAELDLGLHRAVLEPDQPQIAVAARDGGELAGDRRSAVDVAVGLDLPQQRAVAAPQGVERVVVGAEHQVVAVEVGAGDDAGQGLEAPLLGAARGVDGVEDPRLVAEVDDAAVDRRRRLDLGAGLELPGGLAGREIDRVQGAVERADEHLAAGDRRGGLDVAAGLIAPQQRRLRRKLARRDAGRAWGCRGRSATRRRRDHATRRVTGHVLGRGRGVAAPGDHEREAIDQRGSCAQRRARTALAKSFSSFRVPTGRARAASASLSSRGLCRSVHCSSASAASAGSASTAIPTLESRDGRPPAARSASSRRARASAASGFGNADQLAIGRRRHRRVDANHRRQHQRDRHAVRHAELRGERVGAGVRGAEHRRLDRGAGEVRAQQHVGPRALARATSHHRLVGSLEQTPRLTREQTRQRVGARG